MSFVAGTTTIPMAAGLVTAVALFLAWSVYAVRGQRAEVLRPVASTSAASTSVASTPVASTPVRAAHATPVQVVLRPHYSVAAPGTDAVLTAMAHRVAAPLAFPAPRRHDEAGAPAAPQSLPRSA